MIFPRTGVPLLSGRCHIVLIFPRTGVPLLSGRCHIVLHASFINCAIQMVSSFSVTGSAMQWGGYPVQFEQPILGFVTSSIFISDL